jgi:hypothetical protein
MMIIKGSRIQGAEELGGRIKLGMNFFCSNPRILEPCIINWVQGREGALGRVDKQIKFFNRLNPGPLESSTPLFILVDIV